MEECGFVPQSNHGIMDDNDINDGNEDDLIGCFSDFSTDNDEDDDDVGSSNSVGSSSSSSDLVEDATSSSSSNGPLFEMSSLASQLPIKRGLSKHFEGKSQSFTSLSNVKSVEDLIKPERHFKKRLLLKSSKSYGWGLDKSLSPKNSSITKKTSSSSLLSNSIKRHRSFLGTRPPYPSSSSQGTASSQSLLFA